VTKTANGSFPDRVVDYVSTLNIALRRRLAQFLEVQDQTIRSWVRRKTVPSGVRALRMHFLLNEAGFTNPDWRCDDPLLVTVGKMVAFHVITIDSMVARFNDPTIDSTRVVQFLVGNDHVKLSYRAVFEEIANETSWDFEEARRAWDDLCVKNDHSRIIAELANRISGILPLCEEMISDKWTPAERAELRKRCGPDVVFRLYNAMGALCGERARQHQLKGAAAALVTTSDDD